MAVGVYCFNWTQSSRSLSGSFTLRRKAPPSVAADVVTPRPRPAPNLPTVTLQASKETYLLSHNPLMVPWAMDIDWQTQLGCPWPCRTWNRLPPGRRLQELSLSSFKRQLKTHIALVPSGLVAVVSRTYRRLALL